MEVSQPCMTALTVHEKPVASEDPDEDEHDGQGERQQLSSREAPTAAEGNPGRHSGWTEGHAARSGRLTHGQCAQRLGQSRAAPHTRDLSLAGVIQGTLRNYPIISSYLVTQLIC